VNGFPGPQRQLKNRFEIVIAKRTDDRVFCHALG
jgi:hypothetical protein